MDAKKLQEKLLRLFSVLDVEHQRWRPLWQEAFDYILKRGVTIGDSGEVYDKKPRVRVYDETAVKSCRTLTDGMEGYVTPPSVPWHRLKLGTFDLSKFPQTRKWLSSVEALLLDELSRSNFYQAINEVMNEGIAVGTGIWYIEKDLSTDKIRFIPRSVSECRVRENYFGIVEIVMRKFELPLDQAYDFFGDALPKSLVEIIEEGGNIDQRVEIIHYVGPATSKWLGKDRIETPGNKDTASVYLIPKHSEEPVLIEGQSRFRFSVWRWSKRVNEHYGWGPGLDSMSTIKTANAIAKALLDGAQLATTPPVTQTGATNGDLDLGPGAINFMESPDGKVEKIDLVGNMPITADYLASVQNQLKSMFYIDVFLMLEQAQREMTAMEVSQRQGEKAAVMSSIIGRLGSEFLSNSIDTVLDILESDGRIPPIPDEAKGLVEQAGGKTEHDITIEYVGPLAMTQHRVHATWGIKNALTEAITIAQVDAGTLTLLDTDKLFRKVVTSAGMPEDMMREDEEVAQIRQQNVQAQQAMQQAAMQQAQSEIYKNTKGAPEPGSPASYQMGVPADVIAQAQLQQQMNRGAV